MTFHVPEKYRILEGAGRYNSNASYGNNGAFRIPCGSFLLRVIASDGGLDDKDCWEHVSVSLPNRCPNWQEMCFIKNLFWDDEDLVVQYHPPKSEYVSHHPFTLHLWRPVDKEMPAPPSILVGPKY